ncbi:histone H1 [Ectocarpus siliculosus]|uniref:Histone H1 n=1 Tax=Ectocarpus siliculosus TaxID=2880 RepID=D8LQ80_ECTSI|nr:histone H1 [Ectocarpus siliculosus]|eukprot:CBN77460.1 histone H1 [Ectocarpus siliculosus]
MASTKPTYNAMVFDAIKTLKERNGSSIQAIKKSITATYPTLNFTPHQMRSALKKGVESGKFIKMKASYKLSAEAKKPAPKKKVVKKKVVKKVVKKKVPKKKVKPAAKKTTTKKKPSTPKKKPSTLKNKAAPKKV